MKNNCLDIEQFNQTFPTPEAKEELIKIINKEIAFKHRTEFDKLLDWLTYSHS